MALGPPASALRDSLARHRDPTLTSPPDPNAPIRLQLPVTVVLERRTVARGRWSVPSWYLSGVVVGEAFGESGADGTAVHGATDVPQHAWTGRTVTLYRDACERYWHALIGDRPLVYAVCREREAAPGIEPFVVTIDYDEALAFAETDELVLSTDIAPTLYRYMERFVLDHYRPERFVKRKRKRWVDGDGAAPDEASADGRGAPRDRGARA